MSPQVSLIIMKRMSVESVVKAGFLKNVLYQIILQFMLTYNFYGFSCIQMNEWLSLRSSSRNVAEDSRTGRNLGYLILNLQINVNNLNIVKHIISHIKFTCHIQCIHYICQKHPWLLFIQTRSSLYVHTCQS